MEYQSGLILPPAHGGSDAKMIEINGDVLEMQQRHVVMVVEDDCEMNELERELLDVYGLDGVPAYTGAEALDVIETCDADAVLLDVMLPEMDGFETCRRLRKRSGKRLAIIMLTAMDGEDCRRRGFEAGANAYFTKPFNPDEVISALRALIDQGAEAGD